MATRSKRSTVVGTRKLRSSAATMPYSRPSSSRRRRAATTVEPDTTQPPPTFSDAFHSCIDLTEDDEVFVDLTSIGDQSPIVLSSARPTAVERAERIRGLSVILEYDGVEEAAHPVSSVPTTRDKSKTTVAMIQTSSEDEESPTSAKEVVCPICLDTLVRMRKKKKQMKSTICGHIFCSACINQAFESQKCCPTCRKKLTLKMIHPIFI